MKLNIVIFGLSITSSWGNGHATTWRALVKGLAERGHKITFLERDQPWYRENRDLTTSPHCRICLYDALRDVPARFARLIASANLVILGSYVPNGAVLGEWLTSHAQGITAYYDLDTPVTIAQMRSGNTQYVSPALMPRFDLYLSFAGGPILREIEESFGCRRAVPLYCAVDPDLHAPVDVPKQATLGYLGTYSADRQPVLERLLLQPARELPGMRFQIAGPQYPADMVWPGNVEHIPHLPPAAHPAFYCGNMYTLNVTRADMVENGYAPSVRLFEAAACGAPIISDVWPGLEDLFSPGEEILTASTAGDVIRILTEMPEDRRLSLASAARQKVLEAHTGANRAVQLETYYKEAAMSRPLPKKMNAVAYL